MIYAAMVKMIFDDTTTGLIMSKVEDNPQFEVLINSLVKNFLDQDKEILDWRQRRYAQRTYIETRRVCLDYLETGRPGVLAAWRDNFEA